MKLIFYLLLSLIISSYALATPPKITSDDYRLVWTDEFDEGGKPNPKNWTYEEDFKRNLELQSYHRNNAICIDGKLIIKAQREDTKNPNFEKGSNNWKTKRSEIKYTSACVITKDLHSWKYGRFEIKARIKAENGLWPAIWFLGVEGKWPHNGEIDLMEYYDEKILANTCWGTAKKNKPKWN